MGDLALCAAMRGRISRNTRSVAQLFPAYSYERPTPVRLLATPSGATQRLKENMAELNGQFRAFPATILCSSTDIRFGGDVLYYHENGAPRILYETCRLSERHVIQGLSADHARIDADIPNDGPRLLLNSAGSFNYGHWLIDDLPRLEAYFVLRGLHPDETITILLPSFNAHIDAVRERSIRFYLPKEAAYRVVFLARDQIYRFAKIYHVTPCSLEPVAKSPEALLAMRVRLLKKTLPYRWAQAARRVAAWPLNPFSRPGTRLFVDRTPARGRNLVNREAVLAMLAHEGFEVIDPDFLSVRQQMVRFAKARVVVGIMGAAMANTVFCSAGTRVIYLSPDVRWTDPFFWDLAAVCGHRYTALYGTWDTQDASEAMRAFSVPTANLRAAFRDI
ncbi:glycosyltransferase family 61 protein [Methylobacterium oxalidis]|uniref:Glycosyltransferase 61 catalytic domain-containing protein n=1 Tax=Methylobacterium oxalidis TaxID=944322 RepID=A0A512JA71_9HYPH|nr:glycosyltransferase family 61 protein [Methylobacterium oxalidis]GEP06836.1 hypothetical protein MOX02_48740 [Methylobacterium oxalidis]GJE35029.1 hypothetical protein LDDCCGHA_5246 [Methylobacterium oxalidis]GLS67554.1 hypothetical protein GCM10007888_59380 [Methylobacterium oxalidis]